ncbi:probable serine/threonine-protein kinase irlB isoform X2 [Apis mellifera]|uniref:Probable serine/threonine-protein kinase irlB isoform X2 n=1 Tax=Apis mellifera TaxID=7460 RepID=A0A7M7SRK6_APIME|nr:probable serine/threonine-protein kinase irlB isoform X2 [Apis mellifera]|eukprot:XP_026300697.1 probable serine/threonine-protein kinase irlB isoform X2 [Apis mellifera]
MQNISSKNSLNKGPDVKIFCSNAQCQVVNEELTNLCQQVTDLKETVASLENIIQIKDIQLQKMQRENERLSTELKKQQRHIKNLKQQLDDERFLYQKEKDSFNNEIQRQKTRCASGASKLHQQRKEFEIVRECLEDENKSLREELNEKIETTYNLCIKFLRMKYAKDSLRQKFDQLLKEHLQVITDMMEKLDEAREELNIIVSEKFQEPLPLSKARFLQVVQRNARLVHENATLKVQIQHLTLNIERLKSCVQKPKSINVDANIIAKLAEQSKKRCSKESTKWIPIHLFENEIEKTLSFTKPSDLQNFVNYSEDVKLVSKIRSNKLKGYSNTAIREVQTKDTWKSGTVRARSAPEIRLTEGRASSSDIILAESSMDVRHISTNT